MTRPGGEVTSSLGSQQPHSVLVCVTPVLWFGCCWPFNRREKARLVLSFSVCCMSTPSKAFVNCRETLLLSLNFVILLSLDLSPDLFIFFDNHSVVFI